MRIKRAIALSALGVLAIAVVGHFALQSQVRRPEQGPPIATVLVPQLTAAERDGKVAYDQNCAVCHGNNAGGQQGVAPPFVHPIYRPSHHPDQAFLMAALYGVQAHHWPFGNMPPVDGIAAQDVQKIVTYVRALQRANGID